MFDGHEARLAEATGAVSVGKVRKVLVLGATTVAALDRVAPGVLAKPICDDLRSEFRSDARHHLVVTRCERAVVGMAFALHRAHPDNAPQLFIHHRRSYEMPRRRGIVF